VPSAAPTFNSAGAASRGLLLPGRFCKSVLPLLLVFMGAWGCKSRFVPVTTIDDYFLESKVQVRMAVEDRAVLELVSRLSHVELQRLEGMFDPLNVSGALYELNLTRKSDDPELVAILEQANLISEMTAGSLNLFLGYLMESYGFHKLFPTPPTTAGIREVILPINRTEISFRSEKAGVQLSADAYGVSLWGIQEGYAADQVLAHLDLAGVTDAQVQVDQHFACGFSPDGLGWPVEVRHPKENRPLALLRVEDAGVATASIRDGAFTYRDESYHRHLDPRTGRPAGTLLSATVVAPSCETAAGLARGIILMNPDEGLALLNELPQVDGILVTPDGTVRMSDGMFVWLVE